MTFIREKHGFLCVDSQMKLNIIKPSPCRTHGARCIVVYN